MGALEPDDSLTRVEVGGRRGVSTRGVLVTIAVLAVLVAGLSLGSDGGGGADAGDDGGEEAAPTTTEPREERTPHDDDDGTTTTRRRRPTTTTAVPTPILPGSGVRLLLLGSSRGAELLDLDSGTVTEVDLERDVYDALPVSGGVVTIEANTNTVRFRRLPDLAPVELGGGYGIHAGPDAGSVWVLDQNSRVSAQEARLVELDGTVRTTLELGDGWFVGATPGGPVVQAGGRLYRMGADGTLSPVAVGEGLGVSNRHLVARTCDDSGHCGIEIWAEDLSSSRHVDPPALAEATYGLNVIVHPDSSRIAIQLYGMGAPSVAWVDLDGGPSVVLEELTNVSSIDWLPGDLGLLVAQQSGLRRAHQVGDEIVVEELSSRGADRAVVISG